MAMTIGATKSKSKPAGGGNTNPLLDLIKNRRSTELAEKEDIFKLIRDCYAGGATFKKGGHLVQYPREPISVYKKRQDRAIFLNHTQPLCDTLVGFIFSTPPVRTVPDKLKDVVDRANRKRDLNSFMKSVTTHSLLYTCGILVDSPKFDPEEIKTEADRLEKGLHPFFTLYYPWQIRDFAFGDDGTLLWVLLDDSHTKKDNPLIEAESITVYRLWTPEFFQDFDLTNEKVGAQTPHPCKEVPFRFVNWRDIDEDYVAESIFEDISLMDKSIYNTLSAMDEMLMSGAFKALFFPARDVEKDIPAAIQKGGIGNLTVVPYRGDLSGTPFFDGPELSEVSQYLSVITWTAKEIYKKVGLDKDEEKSGAQSGEAKRREFLRAASLLKIGSTQIAQTERVILGLALKWLTNGADMDESAIEIQYADDFDPDSVDETLARLKIAQEIPIKEIQVEVFKAIIRAVLSEFIDEERLEELLKLVEEWGAKEDEPPPDIEQLVRAELEARASGNNPDGGQTPPDGKQDTPPADDKSGGDVNNSKREASK